MSEQNPLEPTEPQETASHEAEPVPSEPARIPDSETPPSGSEPESSEQAVLSATEKPARRPLYFRFSSAQRVEHWIFMISFTLLGLTGLVQKYATSEVSQTLVRAMGGIENTRQIHHVAAVLMMLAVIYHLGIVSYKLYVERIPPSMLPGVVDFRSFIETTKYFIGRKRNPAQQARYTFEEKIEYWAVVWGTVIMVVTGFMMWNPILTTNLLSGEVIPAAKIAHGAEAVLAVLAIIVWHLYHVLVKTLNKSMFNGHLNEVQMLHEHPLELADIKAGLAQRPVDPVERARRQKIFIPTYSVLGLAMLAGLYFFVSFETTAITTIPPAEENIVAFVPLTPTPLPTLQPTATPGTSAGAPTWENSIAGLFDSKCTSCHGTVAKLAELDLSTYESALVGGQSGPVIVPGDAAGSLLIQIQSAGGHPGQLTDEEIELVTQWINSGAPEE